MTTDELYMERSLQLAALGAGPVAPNPMVGAVLVYNNLIIGEGYHQQYGGAHAEVNCINSVSEGDLEYVADSTLYVSLEPCNHQGQTPACSDFILRHGIKKVVVACTDSNPKVNGSGIKKLQENGVEVVVGVLEEKARLLNKRFFTFHQRKRPYIILKWAQSQDGFIAGKDFEQIKISNDVVSRLVHRWRAEEAAIMVGFNTALHDNPSLTTRNYPGKNPLRITIDKLLELPPSHNIFAANAKHIVINEQEEKEEGNTTYLKVESASDIEEILSKLFEMNIQSVLVEGGAALLNKFIDASLWDEAAVITNETLLLEEGISAPQLANASLLCKQQFGNNTIQYYGRK